LTHSDYWRSKEYKEIIDLGCGQLRNSLFLVNHFKLWICDFPQLLQNPILGQRLSHLQANHNFMGSVDLNIFQHGELKVDAVVIAYVLHTLPEIKMRVEMVSNAIKNTKPPHEIFVAVPNGEYYYRQRMSISNQFNDGHLYDAGNGRKTFYREYTVEQLDEFIARFDMKFDKSFPSDKKNQRTYLKI